MKKAYFLVVAGVLSVISAGVYAGVSVLPGIEVSVQGASTGHPEWSTAIQILVGLTVLSLAPAILVSATSFIRIIVVLSMLRHAIGMQETPPNTVLISLALFLTVFTMRPVFEEVKVAAYDPYVAGKVNQGQALALAEDGLKRFLIKQTRQKDIALMIELSKEKRPEKVEDVALYHLVPAFIINELRVAFQIGFVIFIPFLLIDLIVSAVLMALGMMMVPPAMISLPLKILMFVLIDGWGLVVKSIVSSFR